MKFTNLFSLFNDRLQGKLYWNGVAFALIVDDYEIYFVIPFIEVTFRYR